MAEFDLEYWNKVKNIRDLNLSVNMIKNDNKEKEKNNKKIIIMYLKVINDKMILYPQ